MTFTYLKIIVKVFGVSALVGHTGQKFLKDERLSYTAEKGDVCFASCIAHSTKSEHLEPIALRALLTGGGGITDALHAQMSAFHRFDKARVQESSRASNSDITSISTKMRRLRTAGTCQFGYYC